MNYSCGKSVLWRSSLLVFRFKTENYLPVPSSTFSTSITSVLIRPRKRYRCPSVDALLFFNRLVMEWNHKQFLIKFNKKTVLKQYDVSYSLKKTKKTPMRSMISTVRLLVFSTCVLPFITALVASQDEAYVLAFVNKWKLWTKNNIKLGG